MNCLKRPGGANDAENSTDNNVAIDTHPPTTVRIDKAADTITNNGDLNMVNNKVMHWCIVGEEYLFANTTLAILFLFLPNKEQCLLPIFLTTPLSFPPHLQHHR
jgi:hypothetical protein